MVMQLIRWLEAHPGKAGSLGGWYQQGMSIAMALILVPQVILFLPAAEAGLWFTFQSLIIFFLILQFGLPITLSRQVAFSIGAKELSGSERKDDFIQLRSGGAGISDLFYSTRIVFIALMSICLVSIIIMGELILPLGKLLPKNSTDYSTTWYLIGFHILSTLFSYRYRAFLEGLGQLYIVHFITGTFLLISGGAIIASLYFTSSIKVMAASQLCCGLLSMFSLRFILNRYLQNCPPPTAKPDWLVIKHLIKVACPLGIIHLGRSMASAIQVPLIGFMLGAEMVSPFYIAEKIGHSLRLASMHLTQPQMPLFTREFAAEKWGAARSRLLRIVPAVCLFSLATQTVFFLLSPWFVRVWIGPNQFIDNVTLFFLAFNYFIIASTQVWTSLTIASGHNPFAISILLSGFINILLCILLVGTFGILGIVWSGILSGLLTIYWIGPYHGIKLLSSLNNKRIR